MNQLDHVIILAGGAGTRLWPASRSAVPKQFMDPGTGTVLVESALRRAAALGPAGRIVVVTHADHVAGLMEVCERLPASVRAALTVLAEPYARNTAPAIALAVGYLEQESRRGDAPVRGDDEDVTSLVLAADHIVEPDAAFAEDASRAAGIARDGFIVTFGIEPTRPETGYGYIEVGEAYGRGHRIAAFREKPDEQTARRYLHEGRYLWNSGMFVFTHRTFLEELGTHAPAIRDALSAQSVTFEGDGDDPVTVMRPADPEAYGTLPKISVDYAVMERATHAAVVRASFGWNDVGSWDEVAALAGGAPAAGGAVVAVEARNTFVSSDLPVALCGVEDLIVVVKNGAVLVCRKGRSQLVREAVETFRSEGRTDVL